MLQISTYKVNKAIHCAAFVSLLLDINLIRTDYVKIGTEKKKRCNFFFPLTAPSYIIMFIVEIKYSLFKQ